MPTTPNATKVDRFLFVLAGILILAGLAMMLISPGAWFGLDTGLVGGAAMPLGVLVALYGLSTSREKFGSAASFGEKTAILSLAVTVVAGAYFFLSLQHLGWDVGYPDRRLGGVVSIVITILIAGVMGVEILRRRAGSGALTDEREIAIHRRAAGVAYGALVSLLAVLIVSIGYPSASISAPLPSVGVAHAIILVILLSELVRHATATWLFRRDRG